MKKIAVFLLILSVGLVLPNLAAHGQLTSPQIDALVQTAIKQFNVAGVAVAIIKDGKIVHEKGYGVRSIATKAPVNEHTNFQIASNTKAFTTAALAILIDEGKLNWKDKVRTYLPELKMYNEYVTENFLVEDLLCHRSGLGLGAGDLMDFPDGADFTIQDKLTFAQYFKPVSAFRTRFDYDNQLYFLAGELIARISGMPWDEFIQTRILDPLQMTNSFSAIDSVKDKSNVATPHSTETGAIRTIAAFKEGVNGAAGAIVSNVHDMCIWMQTQLNKGRYGANASNKLFTEARQKEMWSVHTVMNVNPDPRYYQHFSGYGLGWFLADVKGNLRVSHTGGLPGMLTSVTMIPDINLGIVVLTNTETGGGALFSSVTNTIIDSYLGLPKTDWVSDYAKRMESKNDNGDSIVKKVWQTVAMAKNTRVDPALYTGLYQDNWFGKMEVFLKEGKLWIRSLRSPKLNGPMSFYKDNTFAIKWEYQDMNCDALATFNFNGSSTAQSIKMEGISPNIDFSFDFQDLDLQKVNKQVIKPMQSNP